MSFSKSSSVFKVACALNRTHAIPFAAIMVGFKLELTEPEQDRACEYFVNSLNSILLDFFRDLKRENLLSDADHKKHKERCLWLFEQVLKSTSPVEYGEALAQHICELQDAVLR